jgi:hypothetical protein
MDTSTRIVPNTEDGRCSQRNIEPSQWNRNGMITKPIRLRQNAHHRITASRLFMGRFSQLPHGSVSHYASDDRRRRAVNEQKAPRFLINLS